MPEISKSKIQCFSIKESAQLDISFQLGAVYLIKSIEKGESSDFSFLPQQGIPGISDFMAMIIIVVLISGQNAFMGTTDPMATFIIMDCSKEPFPATAYLVSGFIIVIRITEQGRTAVSDLVTMLIIMIRPIRQNTRTAEYLLHGVSSPFKKTGQETGPAPYVKACPRFCYCGRWLILPQKNKVQGDADQNAGEQPPGHMREQYK